MYVATVFELLSMFTSCLSFLAVDLVSGKEWPKQSYHVFQSDTLGFDKIYVIHLERRPERRKRLEKMAEKLKIQLSFLNATDGRQLTKEKLDKLGIKIMPGYLDPIKHRSMTYGEIGCLLSHYAVWSDVIKKRLNKVLVIEDDALFFPMFRKRWSRIAADVENLVPNWDFIYLGRKPLNPRNESFVSGSQFLVWPGYTHWMVAYAISQNGAKKLTSRNLLKHVVPVDEYLPIMFNRHPLFSLSRNFVPRNLIALSTFPPLIEPAWFPVDKQYYSDTEHSKIIKDEK